MYEGLTAEILARAAQRPDASPRLLRIADAVLDGKFSWDDVVSRKCAHPLASSLFTIKARRALEPLFDEVATELAAESVDAEPLQAAKPYSPDEDDFSSDTNLANDLYESR